jgi:hypothetical protein
MDRRRESRVDAALPVRIWGVDGSSRPFMQLASVRSISSLGAVLQNGRSPVKPGEILDVQYDRQKAQFRVVWAGGRGRWKPARLALNGCRKSLTSGMWIRRGVRLWEMDRYRN